MLNKIEQLINKIETYRRESETTFDTGEMYALAIQIRAEIRKA